MANPKGNPQNFEPIKSTRDKPLTEKMNIRMTQEMKEAVKAQEDPPEFCRQAIQKALDEQNKQK
ncbi:hypothetical protein JYQ62_20580 [Nostoc sp. UHCC 0702]|nr:hypothetical protein JYQ62_20580 [Nostoc sp. UHCC 0702]